MNAATCKPNTKATSQIFCKVVDNGPICDNKKMSKSGNPKVYFPLQTVNGDLVLLYR